MTKFTFLLWSEQYPHNSLGYFIFVSLVDTCLAHGFENWKVNEAYQIRT